MFSYFGTIPVCVRQTVTDRETDRHTTYSKFMAPYLYTQNVSLQKQQQCQKAIFDDKNLQFKCLSRNLNFWDWIQALSRISQAYHEPEWRKKINRTTDWFKFMAKWLL